MSPSSGDRIIHSDTSPLFLFHLGAFRLHSGVPSPFKIDCDALTEEDMKTIAWLLYRRLSPFSSAHGVPTGGLRLASYMSKYAHRHPSDSPPLICDDVLTTGGSMEEYKQKFELDNAIGCAIFSRGVCPSWVTPLFKMTPELSSKVYLSEDLVDVGVE
jgi:hypothetical protein